MIPGQFFPEDLPDCRSAFGMPPSSSVSAFSRRSSRLPKTFLDTVIFPGNYFSLNVVCVDQVLLLVGSLVTWALRTPNSVPQTDEWNSFLDTAVSPREQPPGLLV